MTLFTRALARDFRLLFARCVAGRPRGPAPPVVVRVANRVCTRAATTAEGVTLMHTAPAPDGWAYLWELGPAEIFTEVEHPSGHGHPPRAIRLHTRNDVGILQKDAPFELTPDTVLRWRWKAQDVKYHPTQ